MRFLQAGSIAGFFSAVGALASASSFQNNTYDYIVVGGGPSGIITAERFAEAGKKVLLLERGTGPTVSTGANETLSWDHSRTVIDLPGLSGDIGYLPQYKEYLCDDTAGSAGCVLGGGVTLNYMVFVHPPDHDFDDKWPHGWKSNDLSSAADRLYKRNPGTILPSSDGKRYDQTLYTVLSSFFKTLGWKSVDMLHDPNSKHQIYSYPAWNIKNQMRAGPVRTYLPFTKNLPNFTLKLNTKVLRLVRSGNKVTGVEIQAPSGKTDHLDRTRGAHRPRGRSPVHTTRAIQLRDWPAGADRNRTQQWHHGAAAAGLAAPSRGRRSERPPHVRGERPDEE